MEATSNNSLNITTINDVPEQVIPHFFLSLIPSYLEIRNTLWVCKKWYKLKLAIYRKVEQEWPYVRRTQILSHLFFQSHFSGPAFFREQNIINSYLKEIPVIYSATEFMSRWLRNTGECNRINETYALIGEGIKFDLQQFAIRRSLEMEESMDFTKHLLNTGQFEAAFAFSENVNFGQRDKISQMIQSFLIENRGYQEALKLTITFNNPETHLLGYKAFFELGAPLFHQFRKSSKTDINDLLNHPFLLACKLLNFPFSSPVYGLLLEYMILPLCKESLVEYEESMEIDNPLCTNPLIIELFSLIPNDYNFLDNSDINEEIEEAYLYYVYHSCSTVPHYEAQVLTAEEEDSFIQAIEAIPHLSLKKTILGSVFTSFYQDFGYDPLKMKAFWPSLCKFEDLFFVNRGTATKLLISVMIKNDSLDFIREIKEPSTGLEEFPKLVKTVFEQSPDFLNSLKVPSYELLKVYEALFKLFIGQNPIIRLIKDSIQNEYVKAQFKISK